MGFNYAREKRRFETEWKKLKDEYLKAGFNEAGIRAMRDFDWKLFCQRRSYENREQAFPSESIDSSDDKNHSTLLQKFPALTTALGDNISIRRYGWIDDIANPILVDKLTKLTDDQKELLTLLVLDGHTQVETAAIHGCTKQAISKKYNQIKKFLK